MANLPPGFLDNVVAIGTPRDDGSIVWGATGFIYGKYVGDLPDARKRYRTFIVTNRHVLVDKTAIALRFNPEAAEPAREYTVSLLKDDGSSRWVGHPDPSIDVAVMPFAGQRLIDEAGVRLGVFRDDANTLFRDGAIELGLSEGDGVFVLGFPMGLVGGSRSFVIVRQGIIARVRDWLAAASNEILVDASIFPGNSGGPVVLRPEMFAIEGTKPITTAYLVGLVSGFLPWTDVAISAQTGHTRITFEENSGLAVVVPIDFVRELVDAFVAANPDTPPSEGELKEAAPLEEPATEPTP